METLDPPQPVQFTESKSTNTNWMKVVLTTVFGFALLIGAAYAVSSPLRPPNQNLHRPQIQQQAGRVTPMLK